MPQKLPCFSLEIHCWNVPNFIVSSNTSRYSFHCLCITKTFVSFYCWKHSQQSNLSKFPLYPNFHRSIRRGENPSTTTNNLLLLDLIINQFVFSSCVMNTEGLSYLEASRIISLLAFTHGIKAEEIQTWLNHFLGLLKITDSTKYWGQKSAGTQKVENKTEQFSTEKVSHKKKG